MTDRNDNLEDHTGTHLSKGCVTCRFDNSLAPSALASCAVTYLAIHSASVASSDQSGTRSHSMSSFACSGLSISMRSLTFDRTFVLTTLTAAPPLDVLCSQFVFGSVCADLVSEWNWVRWVGVGVLGYRLITLVLVGSNSKQFLAGEWNWLGEGS